MNKSDGIHEVFEGDVQYPYADVGEPKLLHIGKVNQKNRRDYKYTCPYCQKDLRPFLSKGKKNSKRSHFSHKNGERCDQDGYIHTTAKRLLKEKWDSDEPFEITMSVKTVCKHVANCLFCKSTGYSCSFGKTETYNLKEHYTQCLVEKKFGDFIPDLCLIDENDKHDPIFVEIWSKHKNSEKKANSNHMIIEIRLKTIPELEELPKHPITESETVSFSHFKVLKKAPEASSGPKLMKYILYGGSLKSYIDKDKTLCSNYNTHHQRQAVLEIVGMRDEIYTLTDFRRLCTAIAIDKGYDIRSCNICRKYGEDRSALEWDNELCQFKAPVKGCRRDLKNQGILPCKPDDAKTCEKFILKDKPLKRVMETYSWATLYIWERLPDGTTTEKVRYGNTARHLGVE